MCFGPGEEGDLEDGGERGGSGSCEGPGKEDGAIFNSEIQLCPPSLPQILTSSGKRIRWASVLAWYTRGRLGVCVCVCP